MENDSRPPEFSAEAQTVEPSTTAKTPSQGAGFNGITPEIVASEIRDFTRAHERRRRQFPRSALVGLIAGFLAVLFRRSLKFADVTRNALIAYSHSHPVWGFMMPVTFGAAGAAGGVWLVQRYAPEASGSGIPHLKAFASPSGVGVATRSSRQVLWRSP